MVVFVYHRQLSGYSSTGGRFLIYLLLWLMLHQQAGGRWWYAYTHVVYMYVHTVPADSNIKQDFLFSSYGKKCLTNIDLFQGL